ncbi:hypothetical protein Cgig2_020032 [Carnegiea gigantea]|uniref:UspA domain-containing protein n=1 Tax=Carnegiea gigantea TaxID=171969 RepID=A0A9Q1QC84_9CARY|nr:hypothetical protein Cgig2_020032 [Carnegiea gigantea]
MNVMVALDESEESFHALNWVLSNILQPVNIAAAGSSGEAEDDNHNRENNESMVYLVHVNLPFQTYVYPAGPVVYPTTSVLDSVREAQAQISTAIFGRASRSCHEKGVKAETVSLNGDPKDMICQAAEERHIDLLVVGSRGLGMFKRAFLGSVSDYCAHHAQCPVLIVKPPKQFTDNVRQTAVHQPKAT